MNDRDVQRLIRRRELIDDSGFRRFGKGVAKEAEECFGDENRPLGTLIDMVRRGLEVLEAGLRAEIDEATKAN